MIPYWLHLLSIVSLTIGGLCAAVIAADEVPRSAAYVDHECRLAGGRAVRQRDRAVGLFRLRAAGGAEPRMREAMARGEEMPSKTETPFPVMVAKGAAHCGSGCTLGDICRRMARVRVSRRSPSGLAGRRMFAEKIFAVWVLDFIFAFLFGIAFQYFTIKPMRDLSPAEGLVQAVKADTLSLTAWQVGMYGFMALAHFWIFARVLGAPLRGRQRRNSGS